MRNPAKRIDPPGRRARRFSSVVFLSPAAILLALVAGCTPISAGAVVPATPLSTAEATLTPQPSLTPAPSATPLQPTATPQATQTAPSLPALCSPLGDFELTELANILSNPFNPPPPGSDDPHHGIDLSFYRYKDHFGMLGLPVHAVLTGTVAMSTTERFPYGNALIIETPLEALPESWSAQLAVPTPAPTLELNTPLTCPTPENAPVWNLEKRSLYLLYAHLREKPDLQPGDPVYCGQQIGAVGNSGNSINEHLHLEVRVGPAGAQFTSMDHYDNAATAEEMSNYCTWRISELFQKIDPTRLLFLQP